MSYDQDIGGVVRMHVLALDTFSDAISDRAKQNSSIASVIQSSLL